MAKAATEDLSTGKTQKADKGGKATKPSKPGLFARLGQYFRDVRSEMKRVVWPTRKEVINSSVIVIVTLVFFVMFTLVFDTIFVRLIGAIAQIGNG